jgi:tetratricopeptide (TPR) repeat protein
MSRVFISYRRADSAKWATELHNSLWVRYGKDLIFQDVDDIKPGAKWLDTIREHLESSQVFLILIGPRWLIDAQGRRRLEDPQDVLRMEVTEALSSGGTVIPVLVGKANMPSSEDLPEPVKPLAEHQAVTLREEAWRSDVEVLMDRLSELILPTRPDTPLRNAQRKLYRMQEEYFGLLNENAAEALDLAQETQAYLDRVLPLYPQDPYLKVTRGYLFKNEAQALSRLGRYDEFEDALDSGERVFRTMLKERAQDAGAWNGLGSVTALRGHYEEALGYINRALELHPGYPAAERDKEQIERILATRS